MGTVEKYGGLAYPFLRRMYTTTTSADMKTTTNTAASTGTHT